jgi:putative redox protein
MKATVKLVDGMMFVGETGSGHAVVIDGPESVGGRNMGCRPMELMLLSVGSCSSIDVVNILRKGRQQVTGCEARVEGERADAVPAVFTKIHVVFAVRGKDLDPAKVKRAVELSAEKYCSASIMLQKAGVVMTHGYEIIADDAPVSA